MHKLVSNKNFKVATDRYLKIFPDNNDTNAAIHCLKFQLAVVLCTIIMTWKFDDSSTGNCTRDHETKDEAGSF